MYCRGSREFGFQPSRVQGFAALEILGFEGFTGFRVLGSEGFWWEGFRLEGLEVRGK